MRLAFLLIFTTFIILECCQSSPINNNNNNNNNNHNNNEDDQLKSAINIENSAVSGRQAGAGVAAPAQSAAASSDDDDDDDDDDDIEAFVEGDDDDDDDDDDTPAGQAAPSDDDDDDDDEDDLDIERIFDDILEDDDDDDDDDVSPSTGVQTASQQAASTIQQAVVPLADAAPSPAVSGNSVGGEVGSIAEGNDNGIGLSADYPNEGNEAVFYDEENGSIDTKVDIQSLNKPQTVDQLASSNNKVPASGATNDLGSNAAATDDDDDDDDDEEDEITGALDVDDDDDDDDDDEEELIGEDVIEAKRARSFDKDNAISQALTLQYNRFADGIFNRINKVLKQSYDPVRVPISTGEKKTKIGGNQKKPIKKGRKRSHVRKSFPRTRNFQRQIHLDEDAYQREESIENNRIPLNESSSPVVENSANPESRVSSVEIRKSSGVLTNNIVPGSSNINGNRATSSVNNSKPTRKVLKSTPTNNNNNNNNNQNDRDQKTQGILYGLASLKRVGNVKVIPEGNNSTIKSKFTLGPLTLKVEKSFKRGTVKNIKSATAKTNEMIGRINLKVVNGAATLVSIKVQQPKQVQVESSDNRDRTREFVWKRTPHIAHLVSEQLKSATETLLHTKVVRQ